MNPTTIGPALYLASAEHARRRVIEFTAGVFLVYLIGGAAIALGPGQLLLSAVPHPTGRTRHILELVAGVAMLTAAVFLWAFRDRLSERTPPAIQAEGKTSAILGATITAVELPTAFPYFAVIAAIVGSGLHPLQQLGILLVFNVCFVAPLLAIIALLTLAPKRSERVLSAARDWLQAHWPVLLAGLALIAGVFVVLLGVSGLAGTHSRFGRSLHRIIHP